MYNNYDIICKRDIAIMGHAEIERVRTLGSGGFGEVFEAQIKDFPGNVAVKILTDESDIALSRFRREVRILSELEHRHIVPVLKHQLVIPPYWFAMPLAEMSVADQLHVLAANHLKVNDYFLQILTAVEYIHSLKKIHRDLKPHNILVYGDRLSVSDFGLGKSLDSTRLTQTLTHSNEQWGSLAYVAPEQWRDAKRVDHRADIYSLGKVLFHMLTNELPFPTIPYHLVDSNYQIVIRKCTQENPEKRYPSVSDLINEFETISDDSSFRIETPPEDKLQALLTRPVTPRIVNEIYSLFLRNRENWQLYYDYFPRLSEAHIKIFNEYDLDSFVAVLRIYDEHISGSVDFAYCDTVSDFYSKIEQICSNLDVFTIILTRLLEMGASHNRWYVMGEFRRLLIRIPATDRSKIMIAKNIIDNHPDEFAIIYANESEDFHRSPLPQVLRNTIEEFNGGY